MKKAGKVLKIQAFLAFFCGKKLKSVILRISIFWLIMANSMEVNWERGFSSKSRNSSYCIERELTSFWKYFLS